MNNDMALLLILGITNGLAAPTQPDPTTATSSTSAKAVCGGKVYSEAIPSAAAFVEGLYPTFCGEWSVKVKDAFKKEYTSMDVKRSIERRGRFVERTAPPAPLTPNQYPGWSVTFDWKPDQVSAECSKEDYCNMAMSNLISSCNGFSLADVYKDGNTTDNCGTFSYSLSGYSSPGASSSMFDKRDVTCNLPTVDDKGSHFKPQLYPQSAYEAAAHQFCYGGYDWNADPHSTNWTATDYFWFDTTSMDPATNLPPYCIGAAYGTHKQIQPDSVKLCKAHGKGLQNSNSEIWVLVVPSPVQQGCKPINMYRLPKGQDCYNRFMNVISTCMPEDGGGKVGVWKEHTDFGCWDWWLWGRVLT